MPHPRPTATQHRAPRLIRAIVLSIAAAATAAIITSPAATSEQGGPHDGKKGGRHDGKKGGGKDHGDRHKPKVVKKVIVKKVIERRVVNRSIEVDRERKRNDNLYDERRTRRLSPVIGACQCASAQAYAAEVSTYGYASAGGYAATGAYAVAPVPATHAAPAPVPAPQPKPVVTHSYAPEQNVVIRRYSATGYGLHGGAVHHGTGAGYGAGDTGGTAAIGKHHYSAPAIAGNGRHPTITRTAPWEPWVDGGSVVGPRPAGVYHEIGATVVVRPPIYVPAGHGYRHGHRW